MRMPQREPFNPLVVPSSIAVRLGALPVPVGLVGTDRVGIVASCVVSEVDVEQAEQSHVALRSGRPGERGKQGER